MRRIISYLRSGADDECKDVKQLGLQALGTDFLDRISIPWSRPASGRALAEMELMEIMPAAKRTGAATGIAFHSRVGRTDGAMDGQNAYRAGPLQPSNAVALKFSQMGCWGRHLYRNQWQTARKVVAVPADLGARADRRPGVDLSSASRLSGIASCDPANARRYRTAVQRPVRLALFFDLLPSPALCRRFLTASCGGPFRLRLTQLSQ
jgi:hypothetical protein